MSVRLIVKRVIVFLLILLWTYAALSKLSDFALFKIQMHNQPLPEFVKWLLVYLLPPFELAAAILLIFDRTQFSGIVISAILMFFFTGYVGLALANFFSDVPCSCVGILEHMTWRSHFIFNCAFFLLTLIALYITCKERRELA